MIAQLDRFTIRTPAEWQAVTCIERDSVAGARSSLRSILYIGGEDGRGRPWRISAGEAIRRILDGQCTFYVLSSGVRVRLTVATTPDGSKCLSTELDDDEPLTLLALPEYAAWVSRCHRRRA